MNIIIEGMDNSGKSTLAQYIARMIGYRIQESEGPEKYEGELLERVARYEKMEDTIFVRHPYISDPIYSLKRQVRHSTLQPGVAAFYATNPFIIYCDPGDKRLDGHVEKEHDSPDHLKMVDLHYDELLSVYRNWAIRYAPVWYRIGDDRNRITYICAKLALVEFDPIRDVKDFMEKFGQSYEGKPRSLPADLSTFRENFMEEEFIEYRGASSCLRTLVSQGSVEEAEATKLLELMLDAFCDKLYVDLGTALLHGFTPQIFREAWRRVHKANMQKERVARVEDSTRHSLYDVRKPPGWQPPSHADLVEDHVHRKTKT